MNPRTALQRLHTRTVNPRPGEYPWLYRVAGQRYISVDGGRLRREIEIRVNDTDLAHLRDQINNDLDGHEHIRVRLDDLAAALSAGTGAASGGARGAAQNRLRAALRHATEGAQE